MKERHDETEAAIAALVDKMPKQVSTASGCELSTVRELVSTAAVHPMHVLSAVTLP